MSSDPRFPKVLDLLRRKSAKWYHAQKVGDEILKDFAKALGDHVGYFIPSISRRIKQWSRICQKAEEILDSDQTCSPEEAVDRIRDIAAGRILVLGIRDLAIAREQLYGYVTAHPKTKIWEEFKEFIDDCRPGGFRGLICGVFISSESLESYPFELQIMTPLQHAWDQLQHPVYETMRSQGSQSTPNEVRDRFQELSERLYEIDKDISTMQQEFRSKGILG